MYRKYYSYSDMPQLVKKKETEASEQREVCCQEQTRDGDKLFGRFSADDVLLAAIIITLLMDDNSDSMLVVALLAVFLSGLL